jgi:hypothetical protein
MRRPRGRPLVVMERIDCLRHTLETGQDAGIWGTTEEQRRQVPLAATASWRALRLAPIESVLVRN